MLRVKKSIAVRKTSQQSRPMSNDRKGLRAVLREIAHSAERSPLFWWMVEHHDELAQAAEGRRLRWKQLCERFAGLGLTDVNERVASERTARATWSRARRAVAEARERAAAKRPPHRPGRYPSRFPADWRPQVVEKTQPDLSIHRRPPSSPTARAESVSGEAGARPNNEIVEFPTVDPWGAPLPDGHVFYRGQPMLRRVAEQLARIDRQAREMDRFK
jgi:hypothetical protein